MEREWPTNHVTDQILLFGCSFVSSFPSNRFVIELLFHSGCNLCRKFANGKAKMTPHTPDELKVVIINFVRSLFGEVMFVPGHESELVNMSFVHL
jgi:hypothetical protein